MGIYPYGIRIMSEKLSSPQAILFNHGLDTLLESSVSTQNTITWNKILACTGEEVKPQFAAMLFKKCSHICEVYAKHYQLEPLEEIAWQAFLKDNLSKYSQITDKNEKTSIIKKNFLKLVEIGGKKSNILSYISNALS